jgi:hypothetical protein
MRKKKDDSSSLLILAAAGFGLYWLLSKNKGNQTGQPTVAPTPVIANPIATNPVNEVIEQEIVAYSNPITGGGGSGQTAHVPAMDSYIMVDKGDSQLEQMAGFKKTRKKRS